MQMRRKNFHVVANGVIVWATGVSGETDLIQEESDERRPGIRQVRHHGIIERKRRAAH